MPEFFTCVEIEFYPEFANHWLRFGAPDRLFDLDRRRTAGFFKPARLFGYVALAGKRLWHPKMGFCGNSDRATGRPVGLRLPAIKPGGAILLHATGKARVKRSLELIDGLEDAGFEPANVSHRILSPSP